MYKLIITFAVLSVTASAVSVEKSLPEFYTVDMDNNEVALSDYLGEGPVVVSFWNTDCAPCKEEQVHLNKLHKEYKDDGLQVLCVSTDTSKTLNDVKKYIKANNYKFTVLLDVDNEVMTSCGVPAVPYTFLLDNCGKVIHEKLGYRKGDEKILEEKIVTYIETAKESIDEVELENNGE
ncbi:MAG: TlpA family protein disulfide reductase [bacterium]|nr:TlpA family protein disulfide reductase [bacterium]